MKMMMIMSTILCFFTICCEYAILMEIGTGSSSGQMFPGISEDFNANPELANIFELYDFLAVRGPILFAHPSIVDDPVEALKSPHIFDDLHFHQRISNIARVFRGYTGKRLLTLEEWKDLIRFTKQLPLQLFLFDVFNKVDTQNEIQKDLKLISTKKNVDELRIRQKYLFKFGFIVDCIYANYMDENQHIDFNKIRKIIAESVSMAEQHPFYTVLTENKCAIEEEIRIFVNLILIIVGIEEKSENVQDFFISNMKERFVNKMVHEKKMNGQLEKEYAQLREDPYFPEKLPKIFNLLALLELIPLIMPEIIKQIKPKDYKFDQMDSLMSKILMRIKEVNILKGVKMLIASHYKRAASQIPDEKLRTNLGAIKENETIFTNIFQNDIKYQYGKWYYNLQFHMLKFLAEKYFGVSNLDYWDDWEKIGIKISKIIEQKTLSHIGKWEHRKKKNEQLAQLHLRIFCVGIRQMDHSKRILMERNIVGKSIFYSFMFSELLEYVPGAMKKFKEIIAPKEKLLEENPHEKNKLFFEAISEVRSEICEENQRKQELRKTMLSFINSESHFGDH